MRLDFIAGCLLSLSLHAGFFFLVPAAPLQSLPPLETPTDTELIALEVPAPPTLQPPPSSRPATLDATARPVAVASTFDATKIGPLDLQRINGAVEKMSAGVSAQFPLPPLQLPPQSQFDTASLPLTPLPHKLPALTAFLLEQSLSAPGVVTGVDKQIGLGHVRLGEKQSPSRMGLPKLDRPVVARALPTPPSLVPPPAVPSPLGIQGPAAKREPLSRPSLPKVQVQVESEIMLKFWVRPDGVVSRVLPERKGDAALEAVAIRYLEGWRFTPLPSHESQVEQWGLITVRFLLKGR